jgi:hypothetical protein
VRRILEFIDWAARAHFVGTALWATGAWAMTFFGLSAIGWDAGTVWVGSVVVGACLALIFIAVRTRGVKATSHPAVIAARTTASPCLGIIFDETNTGKKFWSIEQMTDENGKKVPGSQFWEYRALIKNTSAKTLRNVKVTVEAIGPLPARPAPSQFDINKKHLIDLNPDEEALVLIRRWFYPSVVAGMASGTDVYGPIKMTASADDVPQTVKFFHFNPERTPMIFE